MVHPRLSTTPLEASGVLFKSTGEIGNFRHSWPGALTLAVAVGCIYFVAARLGLALRSDTGVAAFWPAAGIAIATLAIWGPSARLPVSAAVIVATAAANLSIGRHGGLAVTFGLINAAQSLFTVWLIQRWAGRGFKLAGVREVLGFLLASAAGAAMAAVGAAGAVRLVHSAASPLGVWRLWFAACLLGIVIVAPLLVAFSQAARNPPSRRETIEGSIALVGLTLLSAILIFLPEGPWASALPEALMFPLLLWIAIRCRLVFVAAAALVVGLVAIGSTTLGFGHFAEANQPLVDRVLGAQTFVLAAAVVMLLLAALFAELKVSADRLQMALDGALLGAFSADLASGRFECDARAARLHGHEVPPTTIKEVRRFVHPDDLARIDAAAAKAHHAGSAWKVEYRIVNPSGHPEAGEMRWVALEGSVLCNGQDKPTRLLGVTRDITHQKQSEQALAERNTQLALAGKIARVGSFSFDLATGKMQVSPGYVAIHGLPECTHETVRSDWRSRVHPNDLARLDINLARAIEEQHQDHQCEYRIVLPSGGVRWIEVAQLDLV